MSTDLVRATPAPTTMTLADKMEFARALATASLLPRSYQGNPGNLLFALEYAEALQVSPIHAITSIHVIDGKPSASADLIAAMVRKAGHKLRVEGDDTYAVASLIRRDDPEHTFTARWDLDKARTAGLLGKSTWKNYPGALLRSRAITEVARMGASDALFGVIYTPEELGAEVDIEGAPAAAPAVHASRPAARSGVSRLRSAVPTVAVEATPTPDDIGDEPRTEDIVDAEVVEDVTDTVELITPAQLTKLQVSLKAAGITTRDEGLDYYEGLIGHRVDSSKELTKDEAHKVIDSLETLAGLLAANGAA